MQDLAFSLEGARAGEHRLPVLALEGQISFDVAEESSGVRVVRGDRESGFEVGCPTMKADAKTEAAVLASLKHRVMSASPRFGFPVHLHDEARSTVEPSPPRW